MKNNQELVWDHLLALKVKKCRTKYFWDFIFDLSRVFSATAEPIPLQRIHLFTTACTERECWNLNSKPHFTTQHHPITLKKYSFMRRLVLEVLLVYAKISLEVLLTQI